MLKGVFATLPTVFHDDLSVDFESIRATVDFAIRCGVHGLVAMDLSAEYFTLLDDERAAVVETILDQVAGRVPVIVSVTDTSTHGSCKWGKHAQQHGAAAVIAEPPFFMTQSVEKTRQFYAALDETVMIPIFLQSSPAFHADAIEPEMQMQIIAEGKHLHYVKTEHFEVQEYLSKTLAAAKSLPEGKFLGAAVGMNCATMPHDYFRGCRIFMPPCEFADLYVQLWEKLESSDVEESYNFYENLAPLLLMEMPHLRSATKNVLQWRGVIQGTAVRERYVLTYDEISKKAMKDGLDAVRPLLRV